MTHETAQLSDAQLQARRDQLANHCAAAMDKAEQLIKAIDDLDLE